MAGSLQGNVAIVTGVGRYRGIGYHIMLPLVFLAVAAGFR